jgi:lambda repressor-like predicted transcriptional regulator
MALYNASGERDARLEGMIAQDAQFAYQYARDVLRSPWPEAEPVIAQDPEYASFYARFVLKAPWPAAEPTIAQIGFCAHMYIQDVIKTTEDYFRFQQIRLRYE